MKISCDGRYVYVEASRSRPTDSEMMNHMRDMALFVRQKGIDLDTHSTIDCRDNANGTLTIRYKVAAME